MTFPFPTCFRHSLFLSSIVLSSSCSNIAETIRQFTYPPDFQYVTQDELRTEMDQLAYQLQILDTTLAVQEAGESVEQEQVVNTLRNIQRIGTGLQAGGAGSSHPFLQDYMRDFVATVTRARSAAMLDPPRYYLAGRVAGGCINCHRVNR
ncbi:MAG: hypothetical protein WD601_13465 [Pseudohongiellaceae bacterium]